jgi:hypothetical protein
MPGSAPVYHLRSTPPGADQHLLKERLMSGGIPPTVKSGIYSRVKSGIRSRAFSLALTSVIGLGLALPSTSNAQGATRIGPMEIPFVGNNPCTGEPFAGTSRVMIIQYAPRFDGSGGTHTTVRLLIHSQATSLALNPRKYQANFEEGESLNMPSSGTIESTLTVNEVLVRQGEEQSSLIPLATEDDFLFKLTFHLTINSNGILTAQVMNDHRTECAGPPLGPAAISVP